jgi:hypothetical protein
MFAEPGDLNKIREARMIASHWCDNIARLRRSRA